MVVQKTLDNLKDRPKEDKQVVAIGTAGVVMVILLIGWAFLFFRSVRNEQISADPYGALDIPADAGTLSPAQQTSATYNTSNSDPFGGQGGGQ